MKWITAKDITTWAATEGRLCQQTMPELVRRLIHATAPSIERIDFPTDDSIATGGWDGSLETISTSPFFPSGTSGWEIGTETSAGSKASEDYKKRTANSLGLDKKKSTFVFVTPRAWPAKKKWEIEKKKDKKWKEVRVIAADELEAWLASAPAVALWLARKMNKLASGEVRDIEEVWEEWSLTTNPVMTTDIVIAGRTRELDKVHHWATQPPSLIEIQGDSPDEAYAFLYASLSKLTPEEQANVFSKCVVIEDIQQMRACIKTFSTPLIIAAPADCTQAAPLAISKGHHVFVSIDSQTAIVGSGVVRLPRPQRDPLEKALKATGLSELEVKRHIRDSGRSIAVLRRRLSTSSVIKKPNWIESFPSQILTALLVAGSWNEEKGEDKKILEKLSEMKYDELKIELEKLSKVGDSPVRHIGSVWALKSPLDAWFLISHLLTEPTLKKVGQVIQSVLAEKDPKYNLSVDKRWAASMYGKSLKYSEWLRRGMSESLVLLAVYGNGQDEDTSKSQMFVDSIVQSLLSKAKTWKAWSSLKDVTPLLAEASPTTFIQSLREKINISPNIFISLMKDDGMTLGECHHSGLLWALEATAWSPEYFSDTVSILTLLSKLDPGGGWNNRPANSLKDLFLPGLPQTNASPSERIASFDNLINQEPEIGWKLAQNSMNGTVSPSYQFHWRDNGGHRTGLDHENVQDHNEYVKELLPRLEQLSYATNENLIESVHSFINVNDEIRQGVVRALNNAKPEQYSKEERDKMRSNLRHTLNWINSYGDERIRKHSQPLHSALKKFDPEDVIERVGWLVADPWVQLPEGDPKDYDDKNQNILEKRKQAAREMLDKTSLKKIFEFVKKAQYAWFLGDVMGRAVKSEKEESTILDAMLKDEKLPYHLISGFAQGRIGSTDKTWIEKQIKKLKKRKTYTDYGCALLYLGESEGIAVWEKVKTEGTKVEKHYWKLASGFSKEDYSKDGEFAVEKLLDAKRPNAAIKIAGDHRTSINSKLLQRLLMDLLANTEAQKHPMDGWYIEGVFEQLHSRNELSLEEIAKLEWPFIKVLDNHGTSNLTLAIHKVLQKDPAFFTQLISILYKRDDGKPDPQKNNATEKQRESMASNAWDIFHRWTLVPGFNPDGSVDEKTLFEWVENARKQCSEIGKGIGCDLKIADMLSRAPADPDGIWPHIAVRNLIEKLRSDMIDKHIPIGIYNGRGVTSRGVYDGGKQERSLSDKYLEMSKKVSIKWPRTAAILRSISESYQWDAKRFDVDSDLNDLRFG